MSLESELNREIRTDAVDFSFGEIANLHRDNEIVIAPEYQRLFRWSNEQRSRLIESIILQLPIPPIFLVENDDGVLELIDGLQRTSSVIQFIDHDALDLPELKLSGCDILENINGRTFDTLPLSIRLRIKRTPIRAVIVKKSGDEFIKYELFKRLNTGGSLLSAQEIRNCSSRMINGGAEFYSFLQSLAARECFSTSIARLPDTQKEQKGDEELVLRFFAVNHYFEGYRGNVREWLDSYMQDILFRDIEFDYEILEREFVDVFEFIARNFGGDAFARYRDGSPQGRLAPAYFEAVVGAIPKLDSAIANVPAPRLRRTLIAAFDDEIFKEYTGPGANSIEKLANRIAVVEEYFERLL